MPNTKPIQILALDHIVLRTDNVNAMLRFYTEILGCEIERALPNEIGLTQLRAGNALIDIVNVDSELGRLGGQAPAGEGHNMDHFCLTLAPISQQDLLDYLNQFGITGKFEQRYGAQGFGQSIYIQDPDGNTVELKSDGQHQA